MKHISIDLHDECCSRESKCRHFGMLFMMKNYAFTSQNDPNFYNETYNEYLKRGNFGHFISFDDKPSRHPSAVIEFSDYENFNSYFDKLPKNVVRDYKIAEGKRYIFEEFNFNNYIPDIHEIHQSTLKRKQKMNPYYLRSIEQMGGYPEEDRPIDEPACESHHTKWFGVFRYLKNYKQGKVTTNKKLIAYCGVAKDGDLSVITFLFCHTDYLKNGAMFYLLINTIRESWYTSKCIQYWSMSRSLENPDIITWKKRMLFEPAWLHAKPLRNGGVV